jgi:hypothetical protein
VLVDPEAEGLVERPRGHKVTYRQVDEDHAHAYLRDVVVRATELAVGPSAVPA